MKSLFVANVLHGNNEGIYKKIYAEAIGLGNVVGNCTLVIKGEEGTRVINTETHKENIQSTGVLKTSRQLILDNNIEVLYIRLMVPNFKLIWLMKLARKKGIKVFYEIPTYPYYAEQFRSSRKKYRAVVKIAIDYMLFPLIYKYCSHMVVIRSKTTLPLKPKMIEITNGVRTELIKAKAQNKRRNEAFRMVTVGTLYPYHGYDRILEGMRNCGEQIGEMPVEFHVIGASQTIDELHNLAKNYGLKRVFFHGEKTTDELNVMFEDYDVGLGCLALHRRNADMDTTLKIIEYYCRGVPVVTSGKSPYKDPDVTIVVPDNEAAIDVQDIFEKWQCISKTKLESLSNCAKAQFDWNRIFEDLIRRTKKK